MGFVCETVKASPARRAKLARGGKCWDGAEHRPRPSPKWPPGHGLSLQSVQRVADLLAREDLVTFEAHPGDRRTQWLAITPAGQTVIGAIYQRNDQWFQRIQKRLDANWITFVVEELGRIATVFEEEFTWTEFSKRS